MDNNITAKAFAFGTHPVRTKYCNGKIWFVARDVAQALEYSESSMESMARLIQAIPREWVDLKPIQVNSREQRMHCLTEEGLYFFLGRSDKPKALPFQKWVYGEVLPQIRQTGAYAPKPEDLIRQVIGYKRFLFWTDHRGKIGVQLIEDDAFVGNVRKFIEYISDPDCLESEDVIRDLAHACVNRLHRTIKVGKEARALEIQKHKQTLFI